LQWFGERPLGVEGQFHRAGPGEVEDEARVRMSFADGEAFLVLSWNGSARRNTVRLVGDEGAITIADDRLIQRSAAGAEDVRYPQALSAGSHHADWFAAFFPEIASQFREPESSRRAFDEAAACLETIERAYAHEKLVVKS